MMLSDVRNLNITLVRSYRRLHASAEYSCNGRDCDGIIFYKNGKQYFDFGDISITAMAGDILYIPYNSKYVNRVFDPETEYYQIDFLIHKNQIATPLLEEPCVFHNSDIAKIERLTSQICQYNNSLEAEAEYACFAALCSLINIAVIQKKALEGVGDERIKNSVDYINKYYMKNTSVKEIAAMSSMCVTSLERIFKQCVNATPVMYRNIVRIQKAKQLLLSGMSIDTVAVSVGFYDAFHFSRTFKRIAKITPSEYIKKGL